MAHRHPARLVLSGFEVAGNRLQVGAVELEIGWPAPAGILVAVYDRAAVRANGLDEEDIPARRRGRIPRARARVEECVHAGVHPADLGVDDPDDVALREIVVKHRADENDQRNDQGPFHVTHGGSSFAPEIRGPAAGDNPRDFPVGRAHATLTRCQPTDLPPRSTSGAAISPASSSPSRICSTPPTGPARRSTSTRWR